jgi:hypothetical protein
MTPLSVSISEDLQLSRTQGDTLHHSPAGTTLPDLVFAEKPRRGFRVPGLTRDVIVKAASERDEWEQAFRLVTNSYRARGYEPPVGELHFTDYHALPDTVTFVAKHERQVIATLSLVSDNELLGLPIDRVYEEEIATLRAEGHHLVEVIALADRDLGLREFTPVFVSLMRIMSQHARRHCATTLVITINPRHRLFYTRVMGFVSLGPCREYPSVQNHPAEAYRLDIETLKQSAPKMYEQIFGERLPDDVIALSPISPALAWEFACHSSCADEQTVSRVLEFVARCGSPRRW